MAENPNDPKVKVFESPNNTPTSVNAAASGGKGRQSTLSRWILIAAVVLLVLWILSYLF
jgi:hypothetical protein